MPREIHGLNIEHKRRAIIMQLGGKDLQLPNGVQGKIGEIVSDPFRTAEATEAAKYVMRRLYTQLGVDNDSIEKNLRRADEQAAKLAVCPLPTAPRHNPDRDHARFSISSFLETAHDVMPRFSGNLPQSAVVFRNND